MPDHFTTKMVRQRGNMTWIQLECLQSILNWLATISENKSDVLVVSSPHPITDGAGRGGGREGGGGLVIETKRRLILQTNGNMDGERYHQDNRKWHGSSVGRYTWAHSRFFLSFLGNIDVTRHEVFALSALKINKPARRCNQEKKITRNKNISCFSSVSLPIFNHAPNSPFVWPPARVLILRKYGCFVFRDHLKLEVRDTVNTSAN